jgi:cleavage and polyadenylation specificity factor subunit 3
VLDIKQRREHELTLKRESSSSNDMIADSALALIAGIDKSPAPAKSALGHPHLLSRLFNPLFQLHPSRSHPHTDSGEDVAALVRIQRMLTFLESHFGKVEFHYPSNGLQEATQDSDAERKLLVRLDEAEAMVDLNALVCRISSFDETRSPSYIDCDHLKRGVARTGRGRVGHGVVDRIRFLFLGCLCKPTAED